MVLRNAFDDWPPLSDLISAEEESVTYDMLTVRQFSCQQSKYLVNTSQAILRV